MRRVVVKTCLSLFVYVALYASLVHCAATSDSEEEVTTSTEAILQYCDMIAWPGLQHECAMARYRGEGSQAHHIHVDLSSGDYRILR